MINPVSNSNLFTASHFSLYVSNFLPIIDASLELMSPSDANHRTFESVAYILEVIDMHIKTDYKKPTTFFSFILDFF